MEIPEKQNFISYVEVAHSERLEAFACVHLTESLLAAVLTVLRTFGLFIESRFEKVFCYLTEESLPSLESEGASTQVLFYKENPIYLRDHETPARPSEDSDTVSSSGNDLVVIDGTSDSDDDIEVISPSRMSDVTGNQLVEELPEDFAEAHVRSASRLVSRKIIATFLDFLADSKRTNLHSPAQSKSGRYLKEDTDRRGFIGDRSRTGPFQRQVGEIFEQVQSVRRGQRHLLLQIVARSLARTARRFERCLSRNVTNAGLDFSTALYRRIRCLD